MDFPGIGKLTGKDSSWLESDPVPVRMLAGQLCRFLMVDYADDDAKGDFHAAVSQFLALGPEVLVEASETVFRYYKDYEEQWLKGGHEPVRTPADIWKHVKLGSCSTVGRRPAGEKGVYISIECECDWEPEHGLEVVLKGGQRVTKVGPFDGHSSNADAFGNPAFEDTVYVTSEMQRVWYAKSRA